ncbi:MAG: NAD(P)/FAD-dependent oxidoreductase [Bacteroidetes bacterium]|nr:NAD(P)/FAD-dependent oxidoreductase [Bacteroidota bacterium]
MNTIPTYDALIVGGGPAGSTCASILVRCGMDTLLLDRANFPRVKLCAGWFSEPIWDILEISPKEYTRGLWEWNKAHINFRGRKYTKKSHGYFVRRYEFDDFLLKRSNVQTIEDHSVRQIERDSEGYWVIDNQFRARYLIGAGGSHCPVARSLFPKPENLQCGTQEREFKGDLEEIVACRSGEDGEPEILMHDDMKGYSWNVPKGHWLNVGTGTKVAREVLPAWHKARAFFEGNGTSGTIPIASRPMLDKMKGHGYIGFNTDHLKSCQANNVFLIGDALGLAQPMTGEGILPAVLSGKLCATAIADGVPETYAKKLRTHPIISDYRIMHAIQTKTKKISKERGLEIKVKSRLLNKLIVTVFAYLFSGKRIPGSRIIAKMRK